MDSGGKDVGGNRYGGKETGGNQADPYEDVENRAGGNQVAGFEVGGNEVSAAGGQEEKKLCPGILFSILWFLGIFVIGWPVAGLLVSVYLLLLPLAACIPELKEGIKVLLALINFPFMFARNMLTMAPCSSESWRINEEP